MKNKMFIYGITLWFYTSGSAQVFRYEYDLGTSGSGFDSGEGGGGYKSSDNSFYLSGTTDISGDDDPLLIKINSNGNINFVMQYRITGALETISYGRLTADGGYLLYGSTDYNNSGDILLVKTNATGGISWARELHIPGVTFYPSRFYQLSSGEYVLTGQVSGIGAGSTDAYVIKLSADGNTVTFAKAYGTSRAEQSQSIIEHSSGKISFVGYRHVGGFTPFDGWWVQLFSDGTLEYSKTIGGSNNDYFKDIVETPSGTYMIVGQWCSTGGSCIGYPCSGFLLEVSTSLTVLLTRVFYTNSPSGLQFAPSCIYKTPDNNSYWIGGQIRMGGSNNNCLMIKTSVSSPSPGAGHSIGDLGEENYVYSAGEVVGNNDFVMGGTKNYASVGIDERRSLFVKTNSSTQCDATTVNFTTCNWPTTSLTDVTTTVTDFSIIMYTLAEGTNIVSVNKTSTSTAYQDCFLPVKLLSFSGRPENNSVKLFWVTASEENNDFFTLERSTDGYNFSKIGKVKGAGNSTTIRHYELTDENPQAINYYKLSQTDYDGITRELGIISVKLSSNQSDLSVSVQSTPVSDGVLSLNLFSPENNIMLVRITDMQGRTITQEKVPIERNETKLVKINLGNVSDGILYVNIISESNVINRKFVVLNRHR